MLLYPEGVYLSVDAVVPRSRACVFWLLWIWELFSNFTGTSRCSEPPVAGWGEVREGLVAGLLTLVTLVLRVGVSFG